MLEVLTVWIAGLSLACASIERLYLHFIYTAKVVITANAAHHGDLHLPLKDSLAEVLPKTSVEHVLVYKRTHMDVHMESGRDQWLHEVSHRE